MNEDFNIFICIYFNKCLQNSFYGVFFSDVRLPIIFVTSLSLGYKMCARLYLNGDGMGKGTHVSLFFVIMRGSYDALLKWPFRQKVTLMFLELSGKENVTDAFRPDPTSSSFKRPTTEMNIASGCPLFMALSMLDSSSHCFVKDNTAFLKFVVSGEGLA